MIQVGYVKKVIKIQNNTILVVSAHPFIPVACTGGVLALFSEKGWKCYVICMSAGEKTFSTPEEQEEIIDEQKNAGEFLGVIRTDFLQLEDANIQNTESTRDILVRKIRMIKPDIVLTHWHLSTHPDHRNTGLAVADACLLSQLSSIITQEPAHTVNRVYLFDIPGYSTNFEPTVYIDISNVIQTKKEALKVFNLFYQKFGSIEKFLEIWIGKSRINGMASGVEFAETFVSYWTQHYGARALSYFP